MAGANRAKLHIERRQERLAGGLKVLPPVRSPLVDLGGAAPKASEAGSRVPLRFRLRYHLMYWEALG